MQRVIYHASTYYMRRQTRHINVVEKFVPVCNLVKFDKNTKYIELPAGKLSAAQPRRIPRALTASLCFRICEQRQFWAWTPKHKQRRINKRIQTLWDDKKNCLNHQKTKACQVNNEAIAKGALNIWTRSSDNSKKCDKTAIYDKW